jgi:hypothetical protein
MKNLEEVKKQITDNIRFSSQRNISEKEYKRISRETGQLRTIEKYLETNPSEEYLKKERARMERILKAKNDQYEYWLKHNKPFEVEPKDARSFFNKENGLNVLKRQLKMVNLILE